MIFWNNTFSPVHYSDFVQVNLTEFCFNLNNDDTMERQCGTYCHSLDNCLGIQVRRTQQPIQEVDKCFVYLGPFTGESKCYGSNCNDDEPSGYRSNVFGVFRDVYDQYSMFLPDQKPDGAFVTNFSEMCGRCSAVTTPFREIKYLRTHNLHYTTELDRNIIYESDIENCPENCFNKAGCSAFFIENDKCAQILGPVKGAIVNSISTSSSPESIAASDANSTLSSPLTNVNGSGILDDNCQPSVGDKLERQSQFYCLFRFPNTLSENQRERLLQENNLETGFPLETWRFEHLNNDSSIATAQYVFFDFKGESYSSDQKLYRPGYFKIETYTRSLRSSVKRSKRSTDTSALLDVLEKQETKALNSILNGDLNLPNGFEVRATSPIETLLVRQVSIDGSISADCSSGKCECSIDYIDYGEGCVKSSEEPVTVPTIVGTSTGANLTTSSISAGETTNSVPTTQSESVNEVKTAAAVNNTTVDGIFQDDNATDDKVSSNNDIPGEEAVETDATISSTTTMRTVFESAKTAPTVSSESPNIVNSCKTVVTSLYLGFVLLSLAI